MQSKVTVKAEGSDRAVGSGVSVREVMHKHGLTLPQAIKHGKEHNLY